MLLLVFINVPLSRIKLPKPRKRMGSTSVGLKFHKDKLFCY